MGILALKIGEKWKTGHSYNLLKNFIAKLKYASCFLVQRKRLLFF